MPSATLDLLGISYVNRFLFSSCFGYARQTKLANHRYLSVCCALGYRIIDAIAVSFSVEHIVEVYWKPH